MVDLVNFGEVLDWFRDVVPIFIVSSSVDLLATGAGQYWMVLNFGLPSNLRRASRLPVWIESIPMTLKP